MRLLCRWTVLLFFQKFHSNWKNNSFDTLQRRQSDCFQLEFLHLSKAESVFFLLRFNFVYIFQVGFFVHTQRTGFFYRRVNVTIRRNQMAYGRNLCWFRDEPLPLIINVCARENRVEIVSTSKNHIYNWFNDRIMGLNTIISQIISTRYSRTPNYRKRTMLNRKLSTKKKLHRKIKLSVEKKHTQALFVCLCLIFYDL